MPVFRWNYFIVGNNNTSEFTSVMYGTKANSYTTLNSYRYQKFVETYEPKGKCQHPLSKLKRIDSSSLPPCEAEVNTHIKRASFVANMWALADKNLLQQHPAKENGWEITMDTTSLYGLRESSCLKASFQKRRNFQNVKKMT